MKKLIIEIEISDLAFDLLNRLKNEECAEFRDSEYDSFEKQYEWLEKNTTNFPSKSELYDKFYRRNFCDLKDFQELIDEGLVDINDMSWHLTYKLTQKGKQMLDQNS